MLSRRQFNALAGSALCLALTGQTRAQAPGGKVKAVVELFTSQGCAQCPPADALLTTLAERDDVVALAYHVDYWDYIGWEDTFGAKDFSDRQRAYAKSWGSSRIYTPQMVVNGAKAVVGSRRDEVHDAVETASLGLSVELQRDGDMLRVSVPRNSSYGDATVSLVTYLDRADVAIERGDNAGKSMVYTQVVTGRQVMGMWEAASGAYLKLPLGELLGGTSTGLAVVVQQERRGMPGNIIGAAAFEL